MDVAAAAAPDQNGADTEQAKPLTSDNQRTGRSRLAALLKAREADAVRNLDEYKQAWKNTPGND